MKLLLYSFRFYNTYNLILYGRNQFQLSQPSKKQEIDRFSNAIKILTIAMYGVFSANVLCMNNRRCTCWNNGLVKYYGNSAFAKPALKVYRDSQKKRKSKAPMTFNPQKLNIKNVNFWEDRLKTKN